MMIGMMMKPVVVTVVPVMPPITHSYGIRTPESPCLMSLISAAMMFGIKPSIISGPMIVPIANLYGFRKA